MMPQKVTSLEARDAHFPLQHGAGSDAVHSGAEYAFEDGVYVTPQAPGSSSDLKDVRPQ
jgi:hypothetical protein